MIDASVMRDSTTKKSRGFGFVQFAVSASGQKAVAATLASGRFELDGRAIEVKSAVPVGAITGSPSSLQPVSSPRGSPSSTAGTKSQSALTSSPQTVATRPIATSTSSSSNSCSNTTGSYCYWIRCSIFNIINISNISH